MMKINKQLIIKTLTLIFVLNSGFVFSNVYSIKFPNSSLSVFSQEKRVQSFQYTNTSPQALELLYEASIKNTDTLQAINSLRELAHTYSHHGNHKKAYEYLWSALLLADASNILPAKTLVYKDIGRHYSYYKRRDKALHFLNLALKTKKTIVRDKNLDKGELVPSYISFVSTYRELHEWDLNKTYLDSCFHYLSSKTPENSKYFLKFEDAIASNVSGKHKEALKKFDTIIPWFLENLPTYLVLVYNYVGDTYNNLGDFTKTEHYYKKALQISDSKKSHSDFTPLIHSHLATLYYSKGDYLNAFKSLKKSKELDVMYFDSRSEINRPLLEIQDAFLKEKKQQEEQAQALRLNQFEQEEKVLFLQKTILSTFIIILILFGLIYFNNVRSKHSAEKLVLKKKRELEVLKNQEIIDLKNKELAASVLKLIEKDAFIETLKNKLSNGKGDINRQEAKQIINSISSNNVENWNEFEARFVSINKSFYNRLQTEFPKLTLNDQRLCALVKLNFSSKDIARLLNMSTDSVHTTRSRLRKKLELKRDMNLKQFIANI